jgi:hypothetical protein
MSLSDLSGRLFGALLVADDNLGRVQLLQTLEPVVAVDDAPVEVIEVGGRKTPAVERNERTQIRRDHRDHLQHHPLRLVPRAVERLDDLEPLGDLLTLGLTRGLAHLIAQLFG